MKVNVNLNSMLPKPNFNSSMAGTCSSSVLTETISTIFALGASTGGSGIVIGWSLHSIFIYVGVIMNFDLISLRSAERRCTSRLFAIIGSVFPIN